MKKFAIAAALASVIATPVFADAKIAVVDMQNLLQNSASAKKIGEQMRAKFADRQKQIADMQKQVQADVAKLKKGTSTMQAKDLADLKTKVNKETVNLQQMQAKFFQDVGVERNKAMQDFYGKLQGVVADVAKKDGYTLVMPKRLTLYTQDNADITPQVQKALG